MHQFANKFIEGEDKYLEKWKQLSAKVEPFSYRFFSHYVGPCADIVPENIGRSFIESKLNPVQMRGYYEDKNMFPFICGKENVPHSIICRMNGGKLLDENLNQLNSSFANYLIGFDRLILKPSVGSSSGRGVMLFSLQDDGSFISSEGLVLSKEFLYEYNENFVLQAAVKQHPDMSYFCSTSVNTIRLAVYRSWKDEQPHVLAAVMRVGKNGAFVDNAHAGGMFVGIDVNSGEVGKKLFDQYGNSCDQWNGLDYTVKKYIPCWADVIKLAKDVSSKVKHHRLLALDLAIDINGKPILIEYNLRGFSYWLFMFTNQKPLGDFTDEIIDFCKKV